MPSSNATGPTWMMSDRGAVWSFSRVPNSSRNINGNKIVKKTAVRSRKKPIAMARDRLLKLLLIAVLPSGQVEEHVLERAAAHGQPAQRGPVGERGQHGRRVAGGDREGYTVVGDLGVGKQSPRVR